MKPLGREFYLKDTLTVAKELIGKYLIREYNGIILAGRITETEAYVGAIDKACHAYGGKVTPRTETLYEAGGTAYVYFIYGMYYCMNVVTEPKGTAAAVLLRSVRIVSDPDMASGFRYGQPYKTLTKQQINNFSNGPGKLCKAMAITKEQNKTDMCGNQFFISNTFEGHVPEKFEIATSARIGIDYAEEAKDFLWRFEMK